MNALPVELLAAAACYVMGLSILDCTRRKNLPFQLVLSELFPYNSSTLFVWLIIR